MKLILEISILIVASLSVNAHFFAGGGFFNRASFFSPFQQQIVAVPSVRFVPVAVDQGPIFRPFSRFFKRDFDDQTVNASIISLDIVEPVCVIKSSLLECEGLMNRRFVCQIWPKSFSLNSTISDLVASSEVVNNVQVIILADRRLVNEARVANVSVSEYAAFKNDTHKCVSISADEKFDQPGHYVQYFLTENCFSEIYQLVKIVPVKFNVVYSKRLLAQFNDISLRKISIENN